MRIITEEVPYVGVPEDPYLLERIINGKIESCGKFKDEDAVISFVNHTDDPEGTTYIIYQVVGEAHKF